jgi:hypothetical protein
MSLKFGPGLAVMWGRRRENGFWLATTPRRRLMLPWSPEGHDSVFIALGRLRIRIICRNTWLERDYEAKRRSEQTVLPWLGPSPARRAAPRRRAPCRR